MRINRRDAKVLIIDSRARAFHARYIYILGRLKSLTLHNGLVPSVCYRMTMSKSLRRRHYHVYLDHSTVSTHQDRQKAWLEAARLDVNTSEALYARARPQPQFVR